jgi:hypothetical protein
VIAVVAGAALCAAFPATAQEREDRKAAPPLQIGTVEEAEASATLSAPNFGYVGQLGSFHLSSEHSGGLMVVHQFPNTEKQALGHTKLTYVGSKRLGNVDGWIYKTEWDGKEYPSKVFFSAERVYFGGGVNAYIAADYREKTGWNWKLLPLRRMDITKKSAATE